MSGDHVFGQSSTEKKAEENNVCRQIVSEINNFGITQRQTLFLLYLLASELEDIIKMKAITGLLRELASDELFLSTDSAESEDGLGPTS